MALSFLMIGKADVKAYVQKQMEHGGWATTWKPVGDKWIEHKTNATSMTAILTATTTNYCIQEKIPILGLLGNKHRFKP